MKLNLTVSGLEKTIRMIEGHIGQDVINDIDKITEAYARKMAEESAGKAPIKDGLLRNSIASSPQPSDELHVWEYGSNLPYATRQEYEHKTNKAFIRNVVWDNREKYSNAVLTRISRG